MKNQIQGNDQATGNKIRGDEQKIQNGVHLTPGLKSLPATSSAGPSLAPGLFGGQETPPRLVQNPAFFHGVGSPGTPNSDDVEDQVHKAALRTQAGVIQHLKSYGMDDLQLQKLYSGQGLYGMERFLREEDGSMYSQGRLVAQEKHVGSSASGFTFYRPPGAAGPGER